jgi:hypothetical protein
MELRPGQLSVGLDTTEIVRAVDLPTTLKLAARTREAVKVLYLAQFSTTLVVWLCCLSTKVPLLSGNVSVIARNFSWTVFKVFRESLVLLGNANVAKLLAL